MVGGLRVLSGKRFGHLLVLERAPNLPGRTDARWICKCDCGEVRNVFGWALHAGHHQSCGRCLRHHHTAGRSKSPTYLSWSAMMQRCYNQRNNRYARYGGCGIEVCERWHDFKEFLADMGERPVGMTIDRIDNSKGYSPENCRWATTPEQRANCGDSLWMSYKGEMRTLKSLSEEFGIGYFTLYRRIAKLGWSVERAVETPVRRKC